MSNKPATPAKPAPTVGFGNVWAMTMQTAYNTLGMVDAAASTGHHLCRAAETRAEGFREEQRIAVAISHNEKMAEYTAQAASLGIDLTDI